MRETSSDQQQHEAADDVTQHSAPTTIDLPEAPEQKEVPDDITLPSTPTIIDLPEANAPGTPDTSDITGTTEPEQSNKKREKKSAPLPYRRRRAGLPTPLLILVITLVILLIVSGLGLIIFAETTQYRISLRAATTTANNATRSAQQTSQARQRGTSEALSTAQANIEASATAQADTQAQATATVEQAAATASALSDFYTQSTNSSPVFDDPLSDNTGPGQWDEGKPSTATGCEFTNGNYHALEAQNGNFQPCLAQSTRFSSFAYQAHVAIQKGRQGSAGLIFRVSNSDTAYYFFHISTDGSYALDLYTGTDQGQTLIQGTSRAIVLGLGQDNLLTVIANSTSLYLYANGQYLAMVSDSKLSAGKLGLGVISKNGPIDAEFHDAQVWKINEQQTPSAHGTNMPDDSKTPTATATDTASMTP